MTKLDDEYKEFQRKIEVVEERELNERNAQRKLSDIMHEMDYTLQHLLQDLDRLLSDSLESKYATKMNIEYNTLFQNRNDILSGIDESLQMTAKELKKDQNKIDELYQEKSKVFQKMKEKGEL